MIFQSQIHVILEFTGSEETGVEREYSGLDVKFILVKMYRLHNAGHRGSSYGDKEHGVKIRQVIISFFFVIRILQANKLLSQ